MYYSENSKSLMENVFGRTLYIKTQKTINEKPEYSDFSPVVKWKNEYIKNDCEEFPNF